jgi:hypothetical protein
MSLFNRNKRKAKQPKEPLRPIEDIERFLLANPDGVAAIWRAGDLMHWQCVGVGAAAKEAEWQNQKSERTL